MAQGTIKLLLIEDDPGDAALVRETLSDSETVLFDLKHAVSLSEGLKLLSVENTHLILLDIQLPDSQGIDTLETLREAAPDIPVVVLTGLDDEAFRCTAGAG